MKNFKHIILIVTATCTISFYSCTEKTLAEETETSEFVVKKTNDNVAATGDQGDVTGDADD